MKDEYEGKYIELDFSQNQVLRSKHEVNSAHFSGKQFSLHCAIAETIEKRYFCHLSDGIKHDGTALKTRICGFKAIMLRPYSKINCHSLCINSCQTNSIYESLGHMVQQATAKVLLMQF